MVSVFSLESQRFPTKFSSFLSIDTRSLIDQKEQYTACQTGKFGFRYRDLFHPDNRYRTNGLKLGNGTIIAPKRPDDRAIA